MGDRNLYKFYRNKILTLTRGSKKVYFHNYFQENLNNMKKTWEGVNSLINRKKKKKKHKRKKHKKNISTIKHPQTQGLSYDPLEQADILNTHFVSVGHRIASNMPTSNRRFSEYIPITGYYGSFVFKPVQTTEIELEIMLTPSNKAYGLHSCPIRLLKCARHVIARPLATLINASVQKGQFPSKLKYANIVPVYKDGDESEPSNYHPISLLSIFNRIFENVMYNQLKSFLNKHDIFYQKQYGFRDQRSTEHAILDTVNRIQGNMNKGMLSCGVFIDLQKAFDTVDHHILLQKLNHYGIRGIINDWFCSYLVGRIQSTQIGSRFSKKEKTLSSVPQGSVLGPLLFLIYINDIHNASDKLEFYLFADDTNWLYTDKNLRSLETTMNLELSRVCEWLTANKLSLNIPTKSSSLPKATKLWSNLKDL